MKKDVKATIIWAAILTLCGLGGYFTYSQWQYEKAEMDRIAAEETARTKEIARQEEIERLAAEYEAAKESPPTIEEEFQTLTAFKTKGLLASEAIREIDAYTLYHEVRSEVCNALGASTIPVVEATLEEGFRRNGYDEKQSENMAKGLVAGTLEHGGCQL